MLLIPSFLFLACEPDELGLRSSNGEVLDETSFVENTMASVSDDVDDALDNSSVGRFGPSGAGPRGFGPGGDFGFLDCATVEETAEGVFPQVITIDYGEGCDSFAGLTKSGKIVITVTGNLDQAGSQRIVTFENFMVNGNQIEGTRTVTNNGNGSITTVLEGGRVATQEGQVITRESTRTRVLLAGAETDDRLDDVYQITGNSSGLNSDGLNYTKVITTPLVRSRECRWILSGVVETQVEGETTVVVDFGDGSCDDLATRTQDGVSEEFQMEFRMKRFGRRG